MGAKWTRYLHRAGECFGRDCAKQDQDTRPSILRRARLHGAELVPPAREISVKSRELWPTDGVEFHWRRIDLFRIDSPGEQVEARYGKERGTILRGRNRKGQGLREAAALDGRAQHGAVSGGNHV